MQEIQRFGFGEGGTFWKVWLTILSSCCKSYFECLKQNIIFFSPHSDCNDPNPSLPSISLLQDWPITLVDRENAMCTKTRCKTNCIHIFRAILPVGVCLPLMEQGEIVESLPMDSPHGFFFYCLLILSPSISLRHLRPGGSYPVVKGSLITNLKAIVTEVILLEISLLSSSGFSSFWVILDFWPELIFKCYFTNSRIKAREL